MSLEALFCDVDDFCQAFLCKWHDQQLTHGECKRLRATRLSSSEIMTILIHFHQSQYRHFKGCYFFHVRHHLKGAFPGLVSYPRFVALMPSVLLPSVCLPQSAKSSLYRDRLH